MRPSLVGIVIKAIDHASNVLAQTRRSVTDLDVSAAQATRGGLAGLLGVLKGLLTPATLAGGAIGAISLATVNAVNTAARFETMLSNVATLGTHTAQEMQALRSDVLALAPAVGESAAQLTGALYDIVSAGFANADALAVLEASAQAARAGLTTTKNAADAVTTALNAYGMTAQDASRVTDIIQVAVQRGKTTWDEMGRSLGQVIPLASTAGVSFEELNAAIATATSVGINTNQAITGLRAAISNILQPSAQARDLAASLGISFNAATLQAEGLTGILQQVRNATGGNTEQMSLLFGSVEALNTVLALTSDDGMTRFLDGQEAMRNASGATQTAFEQQMTTLDAARAQFGAAMESINISIGTLLLPIIADATRAVAELLGAIVTWLDRVTPLEQAQRDLAAALQAIARETNTTRGAVESLTQATDERGLTAAVTTLSNLLDGEARAAFVAYAGQAMASGRDVQQVAADILAAFSAARIQILLTEREAVAAQLRAAEAARSRAQALLDEGSRELARFDDLIEGFRGLRDDPAHAHQRAAIERNILSLQAQRLEMAQAPGWATLNEMWRTAAAEASAYAEQLAAIDQQEDELALLARDPAAWLARTQPPPPATPPPTRPPPPVPDPVETEGAATEIVGLIANAEAEITRLQQLHRTARTEADVRHYAQQLDMAQQHLASLRRLHELPAFVPSLRIPDAPIPGLPGATPDLIDDAELSLVGRRIGEAISQLSKLAELRQRAVRAGLAPLVREIGEGADINALNNAIRTVDSLNAATQRGAEQAAERARQERVVAIALEQLSRIQDHLASATERGAAQSLERANRAATDYATSLDRLRQMGTDAADANRQINLALEPTIALTDRGVRSILDLTQAQHALGRATDEELRAALITATQTLETLLDSTRLGSDEWHRYARALVSARSDLEQLNAPQRAMVQSFNDLQDALRRVQSALSQGVEPAVRDVQLLTEYGIMGGLPAGKEAEQVELVSAALAALAGGVTGLTATVVTAASHIAAGFEKIGHSGGEIEGVTGILRGMNIALRGLAEAAEDGFDAQDAFDVYAGLSVVAAELIGAVAGIPGLGQLAAASMSLLGTIIGDMSDYTGELNRQINDLADGSRYLSEELVRQLAVTQRVTRGGLLGLLGFTKEVLDEEATQAALQLGNDIANAIARGIREGGEALQAAIDDILIQAAIESAIMDQAVQALIGAWVAAMQAGDTAEMKRLREEFARIVDNVRRGLIDAGLIEDTPTEAAPGRGRGGGVQISEITGPTRDLFADLMSPLIELPVQTMLLRDIRDLLALPRPIAVPALAPAIGTLNITIHGSDPVTIGYRVIEMIERKFAIQRRGVGR